MIENCTCAGVSNRWGHGAECKINSGYPLEFLNSKWCYAETTSCIDATSIKQGYTSVYMDEGRFGASQKACLKDSGKTLSKYIHLGSKLKVLPKTVTIQTNLIYRITFMETREPRKSLYSKRWLQFLG